MNIGVIGGGSWGTTMGILLHKRGHRVKIWEFDAKRCERVKKEREIKEFLPGVKIPEGIHYINNIEEVKEHGDILVLAVPSHVVRETLKRLGNIPDDKIFVSLVKGIEEGTLKRVSEIIKEFYPDNPVCVLSGPSIAREVVKEIPTSVTVASEDENLSRYIQENFMTHYFRLYYSMDVVGVELGGALKNVISLAAGMSDGLGLGANTKGALLTRGIAEMTRLGVKMGALAITFSGLSGIGDLITTSYSKHSRNRTFGERLAKGEKAKEILESMVMVAEGVRTVKSVMKLKEMYRVEMPITEAVYRVIYKDTEPVEELKNLMSRSPKPEVYL